MQINLPRPPEYASKTRPFAGGDIVARVDEGHTGNSRSEVWSLKISDLKSRPGRTLEAELTV
jgi:hypothetical protein